MPVKGSRVFVFAAVAGVLILFSSALSPGRAENPGKTPVVSAVTVRVLDPSPDAEMLEALARRLLFIHTGDPFSVKRLEESIDALKRSGFFRKIHIPDPVEPDGAVEVIFELHPYALVKEIQIHGEFPLLEQEIVNEMGIRVGDPFDPKKTPAMETDIVDLFQKDGYIDPQVVIDSRRDETDGRIRLSVSIRKGPYYRVRRVTLEGNRFFSGMGLLPRLKTWQASHLFGGMSRFVKKDLERDAAVITRLYRGHKFADVDVAPSVEKDPDARAVAIVFSIGEGPRYEIRFSGNTAFTDAALKKDLPVFERGNKGDLSLKRGMRAIEGRYREAGYARARVTLSEEAGTGNGLAVRKIRIHIDEGPRSLVRRFVIEGNRAIEREKIRAAVLTQPPGLGKSGAFSSNTWTADQRAVKSLYYQNGYLNAEIKDTLAFENDPEKNCRWVDIVLHIDEGVRTVVGEVAFRGLSVMTRDAALGTLSLTPGAPFREYMITSDKNQLTAKISESGHPHAAVSAQTTIRNDGRAVDIVYEIDEGPFVKTGELYVRGNFRTRRSVIADRMTLKEKEVFSLKKLLESTRNVSRIQALEQVDLKLVGYEEKKERVDVVLNVAERKPYLFEAGAGYDTAREYYLLGRLENRNLLGINKRIWMEGDYSRTSYRGEAGINDPDFFRSGISASGTLFTEKQEKKNQVFGFRNYGGTLRFQKPLSEKLNGGLAFRYEARKPYRLNDEPIPPEEEEQYEPRTFFVATPSLHYAAVDSPIRPKKGLVARASVDASKGLDSTLDDFFRYRLDTRYYYSPLDRLTLALRAGAGIIQSYASDGNVADDQLFYLGGLGDVRGFDENKLRTDDSGNPVGGRMELLGNVEARYDLGANFEAAVFFDFGAIREAEVDAGDDGFRTAVGVGLSYITPVGPISLMYGHKLDRKENESAGRIHFSIGYTF